MNEFYKLLVYFHEGEKITRASLLHKPFVTAELVTSALELKYIVETTSTEDGATRYMITELGKQKRDN